MWFQLSAFLRPASSPIPKNPVTLKLLSSGFVLCIAKVQLSENHSPAVRALISSQLPSMLILINSKSSAIFGASGVICVPLVRRWT